VRIVAMGWLLAGCGGFEEREEAGLRLLEDTRSSGLTGEVRLRLDALPGETAMLVSVDPASPDRVVFLDAHDPERERVYDVDAEWDSGRSKTGAMYTLAANALNWPVTAADAPLSEGRWRVALGAVDTESQFASGVPMDLRVAFKADADLAAGAVRARIVYVGPVVGDAAVIAATEGAVEVWRDLYAGFGVELEVRFDTLGLDEPLAAPGEGSVEVYEAVSGSSDLREVTVLVTDVLDSQAGVQGFSGGVPGVLMPSARSGVAISTVYNGGADLEFTVEEVRVFGETLAHEVGHWIGLFHPVELTWDTWDALEDTPECDRSAECTDLLAANLMYPVAVCDGSTCIPQDELTDDQRGVMHRSVWVE
jgi:hypothetical protein